MSQLAAPALNQAQETAVAHGSGPLLIIAGAGTGKTRVLVERYRRLRNEGVPAEAILLLTFTDKAARELLDRIELLDPAPTAERWVTCLLYTSPSPRDLSTSRMPSSA